MRGCSFVPRWLGGQKKDPLVMLSFYQDTDCCLLVGPREGKEVDF